jgi:hypothetical protein
VTRKGGGISGYRKDDVSGDEERDVSENGEISRSED